MTVLWGRGVGGDGSAAGASRRRGDSPSAGASRRRGDSPSAGASRRRGWGLGLGLALLASCGGSAAYCKPDPVTGSQNCQYSSPSAGDAVLVTGTAAAIYAVTGCAANGCELPNRCNAQTKRCEPITCRENSNCPSGYRCDMVTLLCR